jgi:hypothetical protein
VPYLIDKAAPSTVYRFPTLDPGGTVTLERVGELAGGVRNLSGADLSGDHRLLAVDTTRRCTSTRPATPGCAARRWSPT